MPSPNAIYTAIDLLRMPNLAGLMRERPLPPDMLTLIQVAAGKAQTAETYAKEVGQNAAFVRTAAMFYIRQVLWADGADHYRVLGANPTASNDELAENFRWFMKWLHPDSIGAKNAAGSVIRVLAAWDALKNKKRREQYDQIHRRQTKRRALGRAEQISRRRIPWVMRSIKETPNAN